MTAIICFDLIPEALEITNLANVFIGVILGVACMVICDNIINRTYQIKEKKNERYQNNSLLKTGIIVGIGLALHNFPEGLAIGSGFGASVKLGLSLAPVSYTHLANDTTFIRFCR